MLAEPGAWAVGESRDATSKASYGKGFLMLSAFNGCCIGRSDHRWNVSGPDRVVW